MKRIFTLLALIGLFISASAQTRTLVTLSHNGELTFFDKISALEDALAAAEDGDKIYLASGKFGTSKSIITINKKVSIVGNGYDSHIIPNVELQFSDNSYQFVSPAFEGVRLEKLECSSTSPVDPIEIKACKILNMSTSNMNNVTIDRCYIESFYGRSNKNIRILNSKIDYFNGYHDEILENCNIGYIGSNNAPSYALSCIINEVYLSTDNVVYENCLIGKNTYASGKYGTFRNCYDLDGDGVENVLDDNLEATVDLIENGYLGLDGTQVGIYGGEWYPYSTIPSVPTVNAKASSVTYDPENNQLKVKITIAE